MKNKMIMLKLPFEVKSYLTENHLISLRKFVYLIFESFIDFKIGNK